MDLALAESPALLFLTDREPELDEVCAIARQHAFKLRRLADELAVFLIAAKAHHPFDAGPVIPGAIEQDDFAVGRQMLDIALKIPLTTLDVGRLLQSNNASTAWVEVFHEAFDRSTLTRRIPPFKEDDDLLSSLLDPGLKLEQLHLQAEFLALVILALHQVLVRITTVAPVLGQFFIRTDWQTFGEPALLPEQTAQQGNLLFGRHTGHDIAHGP